MNKLIEEFKALGTDKEKWVWVKNHQSDGIVVNCDNDDTFITIENSDSGEYADFEEYVGWTEGIFSLFRAMGINVKPV